MHFRNKIALVTTILALLVVGVLLRQRNKTPERLPVPERELFPGPEQKAPAPSSTNISGLQPPSIEVDKYRKGREADPDYDWKRPIEFYGKVLDQNSNGVSGVSVTLQWSVMSQEGVSNTNVLSDELGNFSITGIRGKGISVFVHKAGYSPQRTKNRNSFEYANPSMPNFFKPDPAYPVTFWLFRHNLPQKLVHGTKQYPLSNKGEETRLDILSGTGVAGGPLIVRRWATEKTSEKPKPDWSVELKLEGAGLVPTFDEFPVEAPSEGYASNYARAEVGGTATWQSVFNQLFYFRTENPVRYGLLRVRFLGWGNSITIEHWLNPTGSRSLETGPQN